LKPLVGGATDEEDKPLLKLATKNA
jgi:hypothetical protein